MGFFLLCFINRRGCRKRLKCSLSYPFHMQLFCQYFQEGNDEELENQEVVFHLYIIRNQRHPALLYIYGVGQILQTQYFYKKVLNSEKVQIGHLELSIISITVQFQGKVEEENFETTCNYKSLHLKKDEQCPT